MLLKMLPEQYTKFWPYIKYAIQESTPVEQLKKLDCLNNILDNLLNNVMQAWVYTEDNEHILALVLTSMFNDLMTKKNTLRIVLIYGFDTLPYEAWEKGYATLLKFAQACNCTMLEGFTENKSLVDKAALLGWKMEIHFYKEL